MREQTSPGNEKTLHRSKIVVCVLLCITFLAGLTNEQNVTILRETFVGSTVSPYFTLPFWRSERWPNIKGWARRPFVRKANEKTAEANFRRAVALEEDLDLVRWMRDAERGDGPSQMNLAIVFSEGVGVSADDVEAAKWFRKSAESGVPNSQFNLGLKLSFGDGIPEDKEEALTWFYRAAMQGDARAQFMAGNMLVHGEGVETRDVPMAMGWFRMAADQHDAPSWVRADALRALAGGICEMEQSPGAEDALTSEDPQSSSPERLLSRWGGCTEANIRPVVEGRTWAIKACYERQLVKKPKLAGGLHFRWTVTEEGRVEGLQLFDSGLNDVATEECIFRVLRSMQFEKPAGGACYPGWRFVFAPEGPRGR